LAENSNALIGGKRMVKAASLTYHTLDRYSPSHFLNPLFDQRETQSRAIAQAYARILLLKQRAWVY